jgi:glycosyltransferase involved in cell wall biosynthesis
MRRPVLSVVIPTWNRARLVCEAIESALSQRAGALEVIVIDDGSTDETVDLLGRRFGPLIVLRRSAARSGAAAARNEGVRLASGEFLAFLDSDDLWLPGKLDAELSLFEREPDADVIFSDCRFFEEGRLVGRSRFTENGLLAATRGKVSWIRDCPPIWTGQSVVATCSMTMRRRAYLRLGEPLFARDLTQHEDWEFEIRLCLECRVVLLPEVWSHVRRFDDGTRPERAAPGLPRTPTQQIKFLEDRLTVIGRVLQLGGLSADVVAGLNRNRSATETELARLRGSR